MSKIKYINEIYKEVCKLVSEDSEIWRDFLKSAGRNYKLRFDEQILIYAQRPDATAVLTIEDWNRLFHRWVNKGAKGIAVYDNAGGENQKLRHYFDISDTHTGRNAINVPLWNYSNEYEEAVIETLEASFGELKRNNNIITAVISAAENAAKDNITDYYDFIVKVKRGSGLETFDDDELNTFVENITSASTAYMVLHRLGIYSDTLLEEKALDGIIKFNNKETLHTIGYAVSDISQMMLTEIGKTIRALQRQNEKNANRTFADISQDLYNGKKAEGGIEDENRIHSSGRLHDSNDTNAGNAADDNRQIRTDEKRLSEKREKTTVLQPSDGLQTGSASGGNQQGSRGNAYSPDSENEEGGRPDRKNERREYDALGSEDEQYQSQGDGNRNKRDNFQLEYFDRETEGKSLPFFHGEKINEILLSTPYLKAPLSDIRKFYELHDDRQERIEYIKSIFNDDYTELILNDGKRVGYKTYQNVLHLWEGSYLSRSSQGYYNWNVISEHFDSLRLLKKLYDKSEPLPSIEQQTEFFETTDKKSRFSQEIIDYALAQGSLIENGKFRIYEQMTKSLSSKENVEFLKNEYGWGGVHPMKSGLSISRESSSKGITLIERDGEGETKLLLKWNEVEKRIQELIKCDRYFNRKEKETYPKWLEQQEEKRQNKENAEKDKEILSASLEKKNSNSKYIEVAEKYKEFCRAVEPYDFDDNYEDMTEEEITDSIRSYLINADKSDLDEIITQINTYAEYDDSFREDAVELVKRIEEISPTYEFHLGDKVFIGAEEFEILAIEEDKVRLYDLTFPLINRLMDRAEFEKKAAETPGNEHLLREKVIDVDFEEEVKAEERNEGKTTNEEEKVIKESLEAEISENPNTEKTFESSEEPSEIITEPARAKPLKVKTGVLLFPEVKEDNRTQYKIKEDSFGEGIPKEKLLRNIEAIKLLKKLEEEKRLASSDEQEILAGYTGWGGLPEAFDEQGSWHSEYLELKQLLSDEEYKAARMSSLTAFYTPPVVIKSIYKVLEQSGFSEGNILEPSCGIGNFFGMLPASMEKCRIYGVEIDDISGRIAQQLYQKSSISIDGFENVSLPDSFFDIAVGNVPFGDFKVADCRYDKHNFLIHDYFFAKALDKVRPGGIIVFITSKGTLDKENIQVRKYIAQRAELVGAIRLPDDTFKKNAGTEVTADIIVLQKRDSNIDVMPEWIYLGKDDNGIIINQYFIDNPEMILGSMQIVSGRFGPESTCKADNEVPFEVQLENAVGLLHTQITERTVAEPEMADEEYIIADPNVRNFSFAVCNDRIYFRENSIMKPVTLTATAENRIKKLIAVRDCLRKLIEYQTEDYPESFIKEEQERLNSLYDSFTKKYGLITSRANSSAFSDDSSYFLLTALEILNDDGTLKRKADIFHKRTIKPQRKIAKAETSVEALGISIGEKAKVDIGFMAQICTKTEEEVVDDLKGIIFLNHRWREDSTEEKYLAADEYLSGNVREKLREAKLAAEAEPELFMVNVEALEKALPKDLSASEISVRLGAVWTPEDIIEEFIYETIGTPEYMKRRIRVHFSKYTGEWAIENKNIDMNNVKAYKTFGTSRINAYKIIEQTLNLKDVRIFDYQYDDNGEKRAVLNKKETAIAQGKQEQLKQSFSDWIWKDTDRRNRLCRLYNDRFNSIRTREYDGSHIVFEGMNPDITLKEHQKNAVARVLYGGNTLLAHCVGAGKTFEMAAAAMESKRLGLCNKSLFVVPNHLINQWASEFLQLYPAANLLVSTKKDFEKKNRKRFCSRIATGDYDAVIIGHSQFEKIPISAERQIALIEREIEDITNGISELKRKNGDRYSVKSLEKTKKVLETKLKKLSDQSRKDDVVSFEELGVDRIFIDESHYYKNLYLYTKMRNVGGIAQTEAQKSSDLYAKCRYLDEITGGRGVIFATGTPVSNSMVELYTIQRYLEYGRLKEAGLETFDAWASTFGETVTAIELAPEGTGYRTKTRFAKFYNLPELMSMFKEVADIQTADMLDLPVPEAEYVNISVKPSEMQKEMVKELAERAERIRNKMVSSGEDNMLKVTNDGRKLALDQRLANPLLPDCEESKVNVCINQIYEIWESGKEQKLTQLVFCDLSTPKDDGSFDVYNDIRKKLVGKGVPECEIKFIHEADTERKKSELFSKVRNGEVRVLIGSTQKMGAGTNVQERLVALQDLDCPWRPSDLEQRSGRIIRQGNTNEKVSIFRYVTEGTFDAYLYQLVETKQKFISQIYTSKTPARSAEDVDAAALSYAEIKMLASDNPHIKEKMDLDIQVSKLKMLKQSFLSVKYDLEDKLLKYYPQEEKRYREYISKYEKDFERLKTIPVSEEKFTKMKIGELVFSEKKPAGEAILEECRKMKNPEPKNIGEYKGFAMELSFDTVSRKYELTLRGHMSYRTELGKDVFGNITRIENLITSVPDRLTKAKEQLEQVIIQKCNAEEEVKREFPQEQELKEKSKRLDELNISLNMDKSKSEIIDDAVATDFIEEPVKKEERAI